MNRLLRRLARAVANPTATAGALRTRLSRPTGPTHAQTAEASMLALSAQTHSLGIDGVALVMSFDCDTPEDAAAAVDLHRVLSRLGVSATYAVPGVELAVSAREYRAIAGEGGAFINHGGKAHAARRGDKYVSVTDYGAMITQEVIDDVNEGDRIFREVFGRAPDGFRAPHFGSYCRPEQLEVIYSSARRLGYRFCSTTLPALAYAEGPAVRRGDLWEFPLCGSIAQPDVILDSWNYLSDRVNYTLREDYFEHFRDTVDFFVSKRLPAVLNYYVDPAHVVDNPPFFRAIEHAIMRGVRSLSFNDLIALVERRATA